MDSRCRRQDVTARPPGRYALEVRDDSAGLRDEERARRRVPRREAELEETVEDPGRDVGEVERGAARATDRARPHEESPENREIPVDLVLLSERKARRECRALEPGARRDAQQIGRAHV